VSFIDFSDLTLINDQSQSQRPPNNSQSMHRKSDVKILRALKRLRSSNSQRFISQNSIINEKNPLGQSPRKQSKFNKEKKEKTSSIYNVISKFYLAKKFINVLQMSSIRTPKFLGLKQFDLIGDTSFNFGSYKQITSGKTPKNSEKTKCDQIFCLFEKIKIEPFHPFSKFLILWNLLHLLIFFLMFIIIPINICFHVDLLENELNFTRNEEISAEINDNFLCF